MENNVAGACKFNISIEILQVSLQLHARFVLSCNICEAEWKMSQTPRGSLMESEIKYCSPFFFTANYC